MRNLSMLLPLISRFSLLFREIILENFVLRKAAVVHTDLAYESMEECKRIIARNASIYSVVGGCDADIFADVGTIDIKGIGCLRTACDNDVMPPVVIE